MLMFIFFQLIDANLIALNINDTVKIICKWLSFLVSILGIIFDTNVMQLKNRYVNKSVDKELSKMLSSPSGQ